MKKYHDMKEELKNLISIGIKLYDALDKGEDNHSKDLNYFLVNYDIWYSKALVVIRCLLPNRTDDFISLYKPKQRKELEYSTYTTSDALRGITNKYGYYGTYSACYPLNQQIQMIRACLDTFDSQLYDIQIILQADIFDSEIESARHLLKMGFIRAAGAICGVVLEKHFAAVCQNRNVVLKKKNPAISDYNDALKDQAYDTIEWRRIQRLGDIRNLCDHKKDREPTKEEVEELISGTERVTKTIF